MPFDSTSTEIIVYPWSYKNGTFSAPRDSRSVVSDANSHSVSMMLTSGASQTDSTDITYVLPYQEGPSQLLPLPNPQPDLSLGHDINT